MVVPLQARMHRPACLTGKLAPCMHRPPKCSATAPPLPPACTRLIGNRGAEGGMTGSAGVEAEGLHEQVEPVLDDDALRCAVRILPSMHSAWQIVPQAMAPCLHATLSRTRSTLWLVILGADWSPSRRSE